MKQFMQHAYQTSNNFTGTTTGNTTTAPVYSRENEVTKKVKYHSKGYYYVISVSDIDDVSYQVYNGGRVSFLLHKATGMAHWPRSVDGTRGWKNVRKRTHLPATIGATYVEIDKLIEAHKASLEHNTYTKDLLGVEPDNLKMIEGLEKLQEGDPGGEVLDYATGAGASQYSSKLTVSGAGAFFTPSVQCEGDLEVAGELKVDGQTLDNKIAEAIRDRTDAEMMALVDKSAEETEVTEADAQ
jgi:hypothetical protein